MRTITKDKESWKANVDFVALKLNEDYSVAVKAKALWLLGEMGLKYPEEIEPHINNIAGIGIADKDLIIDYIDTLMKLKYDKTENVRHAFIRACENIAANAPELFCEKLGIFYEMITDSHEKLRIEAPEMFRVVGKRNPNCVKPYLEKLEYIAENDENQTVHIHSAGAIRITKKALEEI
ncbi:HEAT repeat domain-containing protein [Methanobrevibacter ruminantium]|uniref:HEAT repeat domain-containing protein n=1 Tax=Methanobrevibacter ruminantium TaxID=83816 RepID=UPI0026F1B2DA|nr:HEAT repeat domain-containing protein [Methanobrevibacter ruminantium]